MQVFRDALFAQTGGSSFLGSSFLLKGNRKKHGDLAVILQRDTRNPKSPRMVLLGVGPSIDFWLCQLKG